MRSRRTPLAAFGALVVSLLASACVAHPHPHPDPHNPSPRPSPPVQHRARPTPRPNIVFVLTDDLSWNLVRQMPHVRAMQRAGTTLSKFYVVDSLCCPSRAAIFTGQYPHNDGVFTNHGRDGGYATYNRRGDEQRSFALGLQHAGYRTAMMGKYLNGYDPHDRVPPGWDEWDVTGSGYGEYDYLLNTDDYIVPYRNDPQSYLTDVLATKARGFVESSAAAKRPFLLEVATFAPHKPYVPAQRYTSVASEVRYPRTPAFGRVHPRRRPGCAATAR